jgi:hypothetical protein
MSTHNFSKIEFLWGESVESSSFSVEFRDIDNHIRLKTEISYNDLKYRVDRVDTHPNCHQKVHSRFKTLQEYYNFYTNKENFHYVFVYLYLAVMGFTVLSILGIPVLFLIRLFQKLRKNIYVSKIKSLNILFSSYGFKIQKIISKIKFQKLK